jgi:ATP-binding cassette, subfamily B, bacterial
MAHLDDRRSAYRAGYGLIRAAIARHPRPFGVAVTGASMFAIMTVVSAWSLGRVVDKVVVPTFSTGRPSWSVMVGSVALYAVVSSVRLTFAVMRRVFGARWAHAVSASHRGDVVDRLLRQPMAWIRRRHTGDLLAAADNDPEAAISVLAPLPFSIGSIVLVVTSAIWLLSVDVVVGATAVVVMPLIIVCNIVFVRKADRPAEHIQQAVADLSDAVHETVDGIAVVKVLGAGADRREATSQRVEGLRSAKLEQLRLQVMFDAALDLIPAMVTVALIFVGVWRVRSGDLRVGEVTSVVQLFERLSWPLRMLAFAMGSLPRSVAGLERIEAIVNAPVETPPADSVPVRADSAIELVDVSLVHPDGRVALAGLSLTVMRGSRVAIVGPTGSGKTTLLSVLAGIDTPTTGTVHRPPGTTTALVFQEPLLFSGTLRHNLELGTDLLGEQVDAAIDGASATEFVRALTGGLTTVVGERGVTLSGGQRQRIALARALVRRPNLLLLDDTTSSLDPTTEAKVLSALSNPDVAETVVIVAARPSTIALADTVVFLETGQVSAIGSHAELAETSAGYREIISAYVVESPVESPGESVESPGESVESPVESVGAEL